MGLIIKFTIFVSVVIAYNKILTQRSSTTRTFVYERKFMGSKTVPVLLFYEFMSDN